MSRPGPDSALTTVLWTSQTVSTGASAISSTTITMNYTNRLRFHGVLVSQTTSTTYVQLLVQGSNDGTTWRDDSFVDYANGLAAAPSEYVSTVYSDWKTITVAGQTFSYGIVGDMKYYRVMARASGLGGNSAVFSLSCSQSLL